jgi:hypothetical protein
MLPYKYYTFTEFQTSLYNNDYQYHASFKPKGLWFAQGDEWLQHMKKTHIKMTKYNYLYELELDVKQLIMITNLKDLHDFSKRYCVKGDKNCFSINWHKVGQNTNKAGIIISPNLIAIIRKYKEDTLEYFEGMQWYLTWDIASGVIWNTKAVKAFTLIYKKEPGRFT